MKVVHISHSDSGGGAGIAAYRIHRACLTAGITSELWVNRKGTDDPSVKSRGNVATILAMIVPGLIRRLVPWIFKTSSNVLHSPSCFGSGLVRQINKCDADIINLHWVQWEMLSIEDIGNIEKPIVWTVHDMWPFCGAEHYTTDDRYLEGYLSKNRPSQESGIDLNRLVWNKKRKYFKNSFCYVGNSRWTTDRLNDSLLCGKSRLKTIGIPLDMSQWSPVDKEVARRVIGTPEDAKVICFGAIGGAQDERKGATQMKAAIARIADAGIPKLELHLFGASDFDIFTDAKLKIVCHGRLNDVLALKVVYAAADLMIVPSLQEAFGQTALEASACGTPVAAFNVGGLSDIIEDGVSGRLVDSLTGEALGDAIIELLNSGQLCEMGRAARKIVSSRFGATLVGEQYRDLYSQIKIS